MEGGERTLFQCIVLILQSENFKVDYIFIFIYIGIFIYIFKELGSHHYFTLLIIVCAMWRIALLGFGFCSKFIY